MTLPYTFVWVDEDTPFDAGTMNVSDEEILAFEVEHDEGQHPTLSIKIKNPRVGLLAPGRKVWAWLAWQSPADDPDYAGALVPLFYGVLVGVPTSLFQEAITLKFIARSQQFIAQKQALAETMKRAPYYDPFFFDPSHRDDPDSILEGWSALWHIDRTTLVTTASDILTGEDGTVLFDEYNALYDSVSFSLGQPPLTTIRVEASVSWTQRSSGYFTVPPVNIITYTGDSFIADWPKPGAGIGGGYTCESSYVNDVYRVGLTPTMSHSSSWSSKDIDVGQCGNNASSQASSGPALRSPAALTAILTGQFQTGVCDPYSDPPLNQPATSSITGIVVPQWSISCSMSIRYDAERQYSEIIVFDMTADTQGVLTSPSVAQDTEVLTISSVDLGKPIQTVLAWSDFAGQAVPVAQIIYPNNPTTPGGLSYQICTHAGTVGATEPVFSDFVGVTTNDGSVVWSSLGKSPITDTPAWTAASFVPVGQIMSIQDQVFNPATGRFEKTPGATSYYMCTHAGRTNGVYREFTYTPTVTSNNDGSPAPRIISVIDQPTFSSTPGAVVQDGSVTWLVLGRNPQSLMIPIGGTPDSVTAYNYFPTARGNQSVEFLICKARARLRLRSRAVSIGWDAPFRMGVGLSCRMNATLYDGRLPGAAATGKIVKYKLSCTGSDGRTLCHVEIGCPVGLGNSISVIGGTPVYANAGYASLGWQKYEGRTVATDSADITYTPPAFSRFDDGLNFPLSWQTVSDGGKFSGDLTTQRDAIVNSFAAQRELQYIERWGPQENNKPYGSSVVHTASFGADQAWSLLDETRTFANLVTSAIMAANPISWSALLKPCSGSGPFTGAYSISVSPLVIPKGIDLAASS